MIYSVRSLLRLRSSEPPFKEVVPFDIRKSPALTVTAILIAITGIATISALLHSTNAESSGVRPNSPKIIKAACQPQPDTHIGQCEIISTANKFQITFPAQPNISTESVNEYGGVQGSNAKLATYEFISSKPGASSSFQDYAVKVIDYSVSIDCRTADYNQCDKGQLSGRLANGANSLPPVFACSAPGNKAMSDYGTTTPYQTLPAMSAIMRTGKSYFNSDCSIESLTVLKGSKVYVMQYSSAPAAADATNFDAFTRSFSFNVPKNTASGKVLNVNFTTYSAVQINNQVTASADLPQAYTGGYSFNFSTVQRSVGKDVEIVNSTHCEVSVPVSEFAVGTS